MSWGIRVLLKAVSFGRLWQSVILHRTFQPHVNVVVACRSCEFDIKTVTFDNLDKPVYLAKAGNDFLCLRHLKNNGRNWEFLSTFGIFFSFSVVKRNWNTLSKVSIKFSTKIFFSVLQRKYFFFQFVAQSHATQNYVGYISRTSMYPHDNEIMYIFLIGIPFNDGFYVIGLKQNHKMHYLFR